MVGLFLLVSLLVELLETLLVGVLAPQLLQLV